MFLVSGVITRRAREGWTVLIENSIGPSELFEPITLARIICPRFAAPGGCAFVIRYSSSSGYFADDDTCLQPVVFLRSVVADAGESSPVVALSDRAFRQMSLSYVCICRTIEAIGHDCFSEMSLGRIAFELRPPEPGI
jgi:hypothetical protein